MTTDRTRLARLRRTLGLALGGGMIACTRGRPAVVSSPPAAAAPLVFDNVTVIDVQRGRELPAQRVVIVGNRIRTVGRVGAVRVPPGARVVDARGKYLIPGLWDMHAHPFRSTDICYPLFIANGVTGFRDAGSPVPLDTLTRWRREILAGTRVGPPRQLLSGPAVDEARGDDPCRRQPGEEHICVADTADARQVVDSLKAAGADIIKTYRLGRAVYFAIAAEARRVRMPFGGHLYAAPAIEASDSGAGILDHDDAAGDLEGRCWRSGASVAKCQPVAAHFRRHGTWWVSTLVADLYMEGGNNELEPRPALQAIQTRAAQCVGKFLDGAALCPGNWLREPATPGPPARPRAPADSADSGGFLSIVHRVPLPILAGTDGMLEVMPTMPPGFWLHMELAIYVAEGLTSVEALQAATLNPAKFLHGTDSLGTVASGKLADLVLLDANPLADITNTTTIRAVVANGRYFDRTALDTLLTDAQARAK